MSTAISDPFSITVDPVIISQVTAANVAETSAEHVVYSNSSGGKIHLAIRTSEPYGPDDELVIIQASDAVFKEIRDAETDLTTQFYSVGLTPGVDHYVGVVQVIDNYTSDVHYTTEFKTASYPQEQLLPYQVSAYPDRLNYRDIPVLADLSYGWGGSEPITYAVNKLPSGLSMDENGRVTGSPLALGVVQDIEVTATNSYGSSTGAGRFRWVIDRITGGITPTATRTRAELFEATRQYAEREDIDVEAMLPTMLTRADALLTRELRARNMSDRTFLQIVDGEAEYTIPDDYEQLENLKIIYESGAETTPVFVNSEQANYRKQHQGIYFTIENNKFRFAPAITGEGVIEVTYFKYIPYMDTDESGNWLLDRWFDIYHNAMMLEVSSFAKDADQSAIWKSLLDESLESAKARTQEDMWTQPGLQIRTEFT